MSKKTSVLSIVIIVICLLGAAACILPWEIRATPPRGTQPLTGVKNFWHANAAACLFVVLSSVVTATWFKEPAPTWRPIPGVFTGLGVITCISIFLSGKPIPITPSTSAKISAELANIVTRGAPAAKFEFSYGAPVALTVGVCLLCVALYQCWTEL